LAAELVCQVMVAPVSVVLVAEMLEIEREEDVI
jgi:hypothetical protein